MPHPRGDTVYPIGVLSGRPPANCLPYVYADLRFGIGDVITYFRPGSRQRYVQQRRFSTQVRRITRYSTAMYGFGSLDLLTGEVKSCERCKS